MAETPPFDIGPDGNIITQPLMGYRVTSVMNSVILARLEYTETPDQLKRGERKAIQIVATPQEVLALAEELTKQAKRILAQPVPKEKN